MSFFTPNTIGQGMEQPQQPSFQPIWDEATTRKYTATLENQWASEQDKDIIRQHASYYNILHYYKRVKYFLFFPYMAS